MTTVRVCCHHKTMVSDKVESCKQIYHSVPSAQGSQPWPTQFQKQNEKKTTILWTTTHLSRVLYMNSFRYTATKSNCCLIFSRCCCCCCKCNFSVSFVVSCLAFRSLFKVHNSSCWQFGDGRFLSLSSNIASISCSSLILCSSLWCCRSRFCYLNRISNS